MARGHAGTTLLLWLMFLGGGAALFACVYLPAWLENRALQEEYAASRQRVAELEEQLTRVARQIEHSQNDPAYLERLVRKEFGIETPGVEIIPVETSSSAEAAPTSAPTAQEGQSEELASALERATHDNPVLAVFVLDQTRPVVMGMSAVMIVVALVFLLRHNPADASRDRAP